MSKQNYTVIVKSTRADYMTVQATTLAEAQRIAEKIIEGGGDFALKERPEHSSVGVTGAYLDLTFRQIFQPVMNEPFSLEGDFPQDWEEGNKQEVISACQVLASSPDSATRNPRHFHVNDTEVSLSPSLSRREDGELEAVITIRLALW